jgi:hypothetical protein
VSAEEHLVIFKKSSRRKKLMVRILRKELVKISSAIGSTKEERRLRSYSEVKPRRITGHRIIVGLTISRSIGKKLHWG